MVSRHGRGGILQDVRTLLDSGTTGGLTDGELLGRFAGRPDRDRHGDEAAGPAFAALVERHGPMVLRVCRSILRDEHDAQDAFQATFLVLVRRAAAVRRQESVASWLHGVALRVSAQARADLARRRRHERSRRRGQDRGGSVRRGRDLARGRGDPPRGAGPAAGALSRGGRALLPGGPDLRGRRVPARLAGRDREEPSGPGPGTPTRAADPPRTGPGRGVRNRGPNRPRSCPRR